MSSLLKTQIISIALLVLRNEMKKILGIATVLAMATFVTSCGNRYPYPSDQDKVRFQRECEPTIAWLESQRTMVGHYPEHLTPELDAKLKRINPYSRYYVSPQKDHCEIWIGSYSKHMWVYIWWSKDKKWNLDR